MTAPQTAIKAAMGIAREIADGQLAVGQLEVEAAAECRALFGTVIGPEDPLWPVHCDVARQAVALGALSGDELAEWAVVFRPSAEPQQSWIEQALELAADGEDDDA